MADEILDDSLQLAPLTHW